DAGERGRRAGARAVRVAGAVRVGAILITAVRREAAGGVALVGGRVAQAADALGVGGAVAADERRGAGALAPAPVSVGSGAGRGVRAGAGGGGADEVDLIAVAR